MAYIRSHRGKFQALVRIKGHPFIAKSFSQRKDVKRWSTETELKMRREDAGIAKVKYPLFREIAFKNVWLGKYSLRCTEWQEAMDAEHQDRRAQKNVMSNV